MIVLIPLLLALLRRTRRAARIESPESTQRHKSVEACPSASTHTPTQQIPTAVSDRAAA